MKGGRETSRWRQAGPNRAGPNRATHGGRRRRWGGGRSAALATALGRAAGRRAAMGAAAGRGGAGRGALPLSAPRRPTMAAAAARPLPAVRPSVCPPARPGHRAARTKGPRGWTGRDGPAGTEGKSSVPCSPAPGCRNLPSASVRPSVQLHLST